MNDFYKDRSVLVTGGAGFLGSYVVDRLVDYGSHVTVVDNLVTGSIENIRPQIQNGTITFIQSDVVDDTETFLDRDYDLIFHMASPASPTDFRDIPVEIYKVNAFGTHLLCEYAKKHNTRILFASTSEAYGDPKEHPQKEDYWGNVNPVGIRSPYDVSKRFGEMVVSTFVREYGLDGRIVRIFNTYGPRMQADDGRMLPTFINQALDNAPLTVHGDGQQTRSFCYADDLVEYILRAMAFDEVKGEVINIGNPDEHSVLDMANTVIAMTSSSSTISNTERPENDPQLRRPDISKAKALLDYAPQIDLEEGLERTIEYFKDVK